MSFFEGSNSEKTIILKAENQEEAIAQINSVLGKKHLMKHMFLK